jgi:F-type H+-transporting ATPase subunit b
MDINVTLFFQVVVFVLFVLFTMKYIWPPISKVLEERQTTIADGLAAAEKGRRELELADMRFKELVEEGKAKAAMIVDQANQRSHHIVEEAQQKARAEGDRLLKLARAQIDQEVNQARDALTADIFGLVVQGSERILTREIDAANNKVLIDKLVSEA